MKNFVNLVVFFGVFMISFSCLSESTRLIKEANQLAEEADVLVDEVSDLIDESYVLYTEFYQLHKWSLVLDYQARMSLEVATELMEDGKYDDANEYLCRAKRLRKVSDNKLKKSQSLLNLFAEKLYFVVQKNELASQKITQSREKCDLAKKCNGFCLVFFKGGFIHLFLVLLCFCNFILNHYILYMI
ncbi:MAG TPA: hypothetical protein P5060_03115 [Candidatus Absconditabacterales bacterium]|nr:hypothetical protein [Candidatus Absconditabacterales bacterium]